MAEKEVLYKIEISKSQDVWIGSLKRRGLTEKNWRYAQTVSADSYLELQTEMADNGFIDLINKQ
jgi:hypothetical protein